MEIWHEDLQNADDAGIIPDQIITRVAQGFSAGRFGRFRPSPGEFINECKSALAPFQRQLYELRRLQSAVVEPTVSIDPADAEARRIRVAALAATTAQSLAEATVKNEASATAAADARRQRMKADAERRARDLAYLEERVAMRAQNEEIAE